MKGIARALSISDLVVRLWSLKLADSRYLPDDLIQNWVN